MFLSALYLFQSTLGVGVTGNMAPPLPRSVQESWSQSLSMPHCLDLIPLSPSKCRVTSEMLSGRSFGGGSDLIAHTLDLPYAQPFYQIWIAIDSQGSQLQGSSSRAGPSITFEKSHSCQDPPKNPQNRDMKEKASTPTFSPGHFPTSCGLVTPPRVFLSD